MWPCWVTRRLSASGRSNCGLSRMVVRSSQTYSKRVTRAYSAAYTTATTPSTKSATREGEPSVVVAIAPTHRPLPGRA